MRQSFKWVFHTLFFVCLLTVVVVAQCVDDARPASVTPQTSFLLIDPGHGGEDGGATGIDGVSEKTLNLSIATNLHDILSVCGISVKMTREDDVSIHDEGCSGIRQIKVSDMNNRLKLYDAADATVSIHQNHFSVAKYHGAQVFYSAAHPLSSSLATSVRERILSLVQPNNTRELKKATDSIFLLHRTTKPAILVECGFLSNPQECEQLQESSYQQQMAFAIAVGVLDVYQMSEE